MRPPPAIPGLPSRFLLGRVLGQGGMGAVYLAQDRELGRPVAIKVIRDALVGSARERFEREARLMARLDHPHLCRVYDFDARGPAAYIVMEYIEGPDLDAARPEDPLGSMLDVAEGLAALHAADVLHRDLKPANILRAPDGRVVISDLGLASSPDAATLTRTGVLVGTPMYLAPEIFLGIPYTRASDWYAWGMTLYQLLEGPRDPTPEQRRALMRGRALELVFDRTPHEDPARRVVLACTQGEARKRPTSPAALRKLASRGAPPPRRTRAGTAVLPAPASASTPHAPPSATPSVVPAPRRRGLLRELALVASGVLLFVLLRAAHGPVAPPPPLRPQPTPLADELGLALGPGGVLREAYATRGVEAYRFLPLHLKALEGLDGRPVPPARRAALLASDARLTRAGMLPLAAPFLAPREPLPPGRIQEVLGPFLAGIEGYDLAAKLSGATPRLEDAFAASTRALEGIRRHRRELATGRGLGPPLDDLVPRQLRLFGPEPTFRSLMLLPGIVPQVDRAVAAVLPAGRAFLVRASRALDEDSDHAARVAFTMIFKELRPFLVGSMRTAPREALFGPRPTSLAATRFQLAVRSSLFEWRREAHDLVPAERVELAEEWEALGRAVLADPSRGPEDPLRYTSLILATEYWAAAGNLERASRCQATLVKEGVEAHPKRWRQHLQELEKLGASSLAEGLGVPSAGP